MYEFIAGCLRKTMHVHRAQPRENRDIGMSPSDSNAFEPQSESTSQPSSSCVDSPTKSISSHSIYLDEQDARDLNDESEEARSMQELSKDLMEGGYVQLEYMQCSETKTPSETGACG